MLYPSEGSKAPAFLYYTKQSEELKIPSIAREVDTPLPMSLYPFAALYLVAKIPDRVGGISEPFIFFVSVGWNFPVGAKEHEYRVKVMATNSRPSGISTGPEVAGFLNFEIERVN
jgi:hypothetical protein